MTRRIVTRRTVRSPKLKRAWTFAVVSDLHNGAYDDVLETMRTVDGILLVGDLFDRHGLAYARAAQFLLDAPKCAPTYFAIGNHEWKAENRAEFWPLVEKSDVQVLDNRCVSLGDITLGAISSCPKAEINLSVLDELSQAEGFRLLMCHHPEWHEAYVRGRDIDLTLSGHAHGGQVQLFGHGLYAPGQGILPRYTHGWYDHGRLLVSRGMHNSIGLPRWNNPCEMILLHLAPGEEAYE